MKTQNTLFMIATLVHAQSYEQEAAQERIAYARRTTAAVLSHQNPERSYTFSAIGKKNDQLVAVRSPSEGYWTKSDVDDWLRSETSEWRNLGFKKVTFIHAARKADDSRTVISLGKGKVCIFATFSVKPIR